jgi:hypothetical protein
LPLLRPQQMARAPHNVAGKSSETVKTFFTFCG